MAYELVLISLVLFLCSCQIHYSVITVVYNRVDIDSLTSYGGFAASG